MVKQSVDICEKKGVLGAGYIPKLHWTDALRQLRRAVRLLPLRRGELHPDVPHAGRTGSGWAGTTGLKDVTKIDAAALTESRGRQGAEVAQAARARARQLHRDPRTAAGGALPVADARSRSTRAPAEEGRSFMSGKRARHDQARPEGVRRQLHDSQRHRQPDPAADADRPGRPRRAAHHLGRERRRQEPVLRPLLGEEAEEGVHADRAAAEPGDGRRRRDRSRR